jgi:hypothetical protein
MDPLVFYSEYVQQASRRKDVRALLPDVPAEETITLKEEDIEDESLTVEDSKDKLKRFVKPGDHSLVDPSTLPTTDGNISPHTQSPKRKMSVTHLLYSAVSSDSSSSARRNLKWQSSSSSLLTKKNIPHAGSNTCLLSTLFPDAVLSDLRARFPLSPSLLTCKYSCVGNSLLQSHNSCNPLYPL